VTIRVHSYVDGVCKSCGAVKNNDHIGPSWCSGRPTARAEANTLRAEVERLTRERDEARAELARLQKAAALENALFVERLEAALKSSRSSET